MKSIVIASALFLARPALIAAQHLPESDSALVGCYALTWRAGPRATPFFPDTVVLTLVPVNRGEKGYLVRVDSGWARRTSISLHLWCRQAGDSVLVLQTDGFSGVALDLVKGANGLHGVATAFTDVIDSRHPFPTWQVDARSVDRGATGCRASRF